VAIALMALRDAKGCSCGRFVPAEQPYLSRTEEYVRSPLLFVGEVVQVAPGTECGKPRWRDPEDEPSSKEPVACPVHDKSYMKCMHPHIAKVKVIDGLAGVETGGYVEQRCTLSSCGDCSPPCPEVGDRFIDTNSSGGLCSLKRCYLNPSHYSGTKCNEVLEWLKNPPAHAPVVATMRLPVSFAVLQENPYFRSSLLVDIGGDLEALAVVAKGSELQQVDVLEDASRTVMVASSEALPLTHNASMLQVHIQTLRKEDVGAAVARLTALSGRSSKGEPGGMLLPRSSDYLRNLCRSKPCYQCSATCVEEGFAGLFLRELSVANASTHAAPGVVLL